MAIPYTTKCRDCGHDLIAVDVYDPDNPTWDGWFRLSDPTLIGMPVATMVIVKAYKCTACDKPWAVVDYIENRERWLRLPEFKKSH